jgi:hypothetical protein
MPCYQRMLYASKQPQPQPQPQHFLQLLLVMPRSGIISRSIVGIFFGMPSSGFMLVSIFLPYLFPTKATTAICMKISILISFHSSGVSISSRQSRCVTSAFGGPLHRLKSVFFE